MFNTADAHTASTHTTQCRELVRQSLDDNLALDYSILEIDAMQRTGAWDARLDEQMGYTALCYCDY